MHACRALLAAIFNEYTEPVTFSTQQQEALCLRSSPQSHFGSQGLWTNAAGIGKTAFVQGFLGCISNSILEVLTRHHTFWNAVGYTPQNPGWKLTESTWLPRQGQAQGHSASLLMPWWRTSGYISRRYTPRVLGFKARDVLVT